MISSIPDLLRLCTIPLFGYAAYTDYLVRRVDKWVWRVLIASGGLIAIFELIQLAPITTESDILRVRGIVNTMGVMMLVGGIFSHAKRVGLTDAKAIIAMGVLYPTFPTIAISGYTFPIATGTVGALSITAVLNAALIGSWYVIEAGYKSLRLWATTGQFKLSEVVDVRNLCDRAGKVHPLDDALNDDFEVDVDTIRMYLRWRGIELSELIDTTTETRGITSIGQTFTVKSGAQSRGDGLHYPDRTQITGSGETEREIASDDLWGVELFFDQIDAAIYGDSPEQLRAALQYIESEEEIFLKQAYPLVTVLFGGLVLSVIVGNVAQLMLLV